MSNKCAKLCWLLLFRGWFRFCPSGVWFPVGLVLLYAKNITNTNRIKIPWISFLNWLCSLALFHNIDSVIILFRIGKSIRRRRWVIGALRNACSSDIYLSNVKGLQATSPHTPCHRRGIDRQASLFFSGCCGFCCCCCGPLKDHSSWYYWHKAQSSVTVSPAVLLFKTMFFESSIRGLCVQFVRLQLDRDFLWLFKMSINDPPTQYLSLSYS